MAEEVKITGETSDGFHTFNELYHHRAVLFSVIVSEFRSMAWKARKHHDGTMYDGMFIVGLNTPWGQASYHYDIDPYWDMFSCKELESAPEWDGHTPDDAIERIGLLRFSKDFSPLLNLGAKTFTCDHCGKTEPAKANGNAPENWDWQVLLLNKKYRGKTFWLCPDCQKELYLKRANVKEAFLLGDAD